ncbi:hypothetical protein H0H93_014415 [Arthromyces matolae]|nr:hypothetical protein H0H93_014415 [Arthromyces matolae]
MFMSMFKLALSSLTSAWYSIVKTSMLYVRALFGPTRTPRLPATRTVSAPYPAISTTSTFPSSSGPLVHGFFLFTAVAAGFVAGVFLIYLRLTPPRQRKHLAQALSLRKLLKAASAFGVTTITHIKSLLPSLAGPLRYASTLLSAVAAIVSTHLHTRYPTLIPRVKQAKSRITAFHISFFLSTLLQFIFLAFFYALQPISHDEAVKALFECFSSTSAPDSYHYRFGVCDPVTFTPLYIPAIAFISFVTSVVFLVTIWPELFDSPSSNHHLPQSHHIRALIRNRRLVEVVQEILMEEMDRPLFEPMRGGANWNQLAEANNREIDLFETPALVLNVDMRKNRVRLPAEIFPRTGVG